MMRYLLLLLAIVLLAPIALRPKTQSALRSDQRRLVIITPHNEAIRFEFKQAFETHYLRKTGQRVLVDFRTPGGTSEIARTIHGEYLAAFRHHWTQQLKRPWSSRIENAFSNAKTPPESPEGQARQWFLDSEISCGIDLFFGGGAYDSQAQAAAGFLVDSGFVAGHPELFGPGGIPQTLGGEPFWDPKGRWIGTALSSFGICFNSDVLAQRHIPPPKAWSDLANPQYFRQIALANPTQSGSVNKAFEMLIQQQMQAAGDIPKEGWTQALQLLMKIGANARYFTDGSAKIVLDVGSGEAAAGMSIDFYGRAQSESMRRADGTTPLQYVDAAGGTSLGADPIGLFRGAPNPDVAREFIAFVLSEEGQRLWNWKPGTPGGPAHYALRRLPILPALYSPEFQARRSDPEINPYLGAQDFVYHPAWTGTLFRPIAFIIRVMCIDPHDELTEAWQALIAAGFPPEATAVFANVQAVNYDAASGHIRQTLASGKIQEVQLARQLADHFRAQYLKAAELARAGR